MTLKKFVVYLLSFLCAALHFTRFIPILRNHVGCQLATKSARLDEKWQTGVWQVPNGTFTRRSMADSAD